ncbi:MAG TPA: glycosyltransferase [Bryobacteraceae bacterium]|nr:glycosyltransferase [Bryobacteraceae bacterium]
MPPKVLIEGPFESDYSLAIVNRNLAYGMLDAGYEIGLHQRDNTTSYPPSAAFLQLHPRLAAGFQTLDPGARPDIHTRYIYPPHCDRMIGSVRAFHCYGWEESAFPQQYAMGFDSGLDLVTVMSRYVMQVLRDNGVTVPIEVVGLGADHILGSSPVPIDGLQTGAFNFLHVSSCFPRKGADVLVRAFCEEFRRSEDVQLIIKTFANPHNKIEELVAEADRRYRGHPPIQVIWDSLAAGQMRFLLENANCLVSASRGEGFGLPVAEAMLVGCPVIATIHGGQADLCSAEWCWPVEFQIAPAKTHLTEGPSFWAEPSVDSLREQMRKLVNAPRAEVTARTARARTHIITNFTWSQVARRHLAACEAVMAEKSREGAPRRFQVAGHIGFISTWNTKCGIAEYTRYLAESLDQGNTYSILADRATMTVRPDTDNVSRCWNQSQEPGQSPNEVPALVERIVHRGVDVVSLQYNFGFFPPALVEDLVDRLHARGVAVMITLHSTSHANFTKLIGALLRADAVIVHRQDDWTKLLDCGVQRAVMQNQGIYVPPNRPDRSRASVSQPLAFTVACFGFFLPPKGIGELLQAFEAAIQVNPVLRLKLLNSLYPGTASATYAAACLRFAEERRLAERMQVYTDFLNDDEILRELSNADLIVLPYTTSSESSSAAIRLPLASGTPILCSDLPLFDEFAGVVHRYAANDVAALANRLCDLSTNAGELRRFADRQKALVEELSWKRVAARFQALAASCQRLRMGASVAM